jgi:hypothetical protein
MDEETLKLVKSFMAGLTENQKKIKMAVFRIAFLMPHQEVNPDLEIEALGLTPAGKDIDLDAIDKNSPEYIMGARDALLALIHMLEGKGPRKY